MQRVKPMTSLVLNVLSLCHSGSSSFGKLQFMLINIDWTAQGRATGTVFPCKTLFDIAVVTKTGIMQQPNESV